MANYSFCMKCGSVILDNQKFCSNCGNRKQYPVLSIYEDRYEVIALDDWNRIIPIYSEKLSYASLYDHFAYYSLKEIFQKCMDARITQCCMTVPVLLDFKKRQDLEEAAKATNFTVERTVTDIAAMAMAYEIEDHSNLEKQGLILAIGNGIVDIGCAEYGEGIVEITQTWEYAQPDPIRTWGQGQKMQLFHEIVNMLGNDFDSLCRIEKPDEDIKRIIQAGKETYIKNTVAEWNVVLISDNIEPCKAVIDEVVQWLTGRRLPAVSASAVKGAAYQGRKLLGWKEMDDHLLLDALPLSVGVILSDNKYREILAKRTAIPTANKIVLPSSLYKSSVMNIPVKQGVEETKKLVPFTTVTLNVKDMGKDVEIRADVDANMKLSITLL